MKLISPMDLAPLNVDDLGRGRPETLQGMPLLWAKRATFEDWLLAQRKKAG